jgi:hypothetical protein
MENQAQFSEIIIREKSTRYTTLRRNNPEPRMSEMGHSHPFLADGARPLGVDTVEKLRKECAAKIHPNAIMCKNRRSMPSQCSYDGLWLLAPQLPRPPKSLLDPQACGPPNFYWSPKT